MANERLDFLKDLFEDVKDATEEKKRVNGGKGDHQDKSKVVKRRKRKAGENEEIDSFE